MPDEAFGHFYFGRESGDPDGSVRSVFNRRVKLSSEDFGFSSDIIGSQHYPWLNLYDQVAPSLPKVFNGMDDYLNLGVSNISRKSSGFPHIDNDRPFHIVNNDPINLVIQSHVVILSTAFNRGTLYFDDQEFNVRTLKNRGFGWRDYLPERCVQNPSQSIWYTKSFAVAFHAAGPWPHRAGIHDFPYLLKDFENDKTSLRLSTRVQGDFTLTNADLAIIKEHHSELFKSLVVQSP